MSDIDIQLALISHTNAGKTTLARTLVGIDLGEVRDAAHITIASEAHTLLTGPGGERLQLWDTPGFGDSVRLQKRLAQSGNPLGWFLREVVDRYRDRPFWLSQQAVRTAQETADVVLYLVNSSEDPRDAGYLAPEMKILEWMGKPVLALLNQMGPPRPPAEEEAEQARWRAHLRAYPVVRDVIALDAFARCWVHERVFYDALGTLVAPAKQAAYARLFRVWETENERRFGAAVDLLAGQLAAAARDSEALAPEDGALLGNVLKVVGLGKRLDQRRQDKAMNVLMARLDQRIAGVTADLLALHRLDPGAGATINARVQSAFVVRAPLDTRQAGLLGAVLSGAGSGLSADLLAGGLSFGAGALVGGIVGALTFASAAWAFNAGTDRDSTNLQFSPDFMRTLVVADLLRYLAVAHFGRGRGNFVEGEAPPFWQAEVESAVAARADRLQALWKALRADPKDGQAPLTLASVLREIAAEVLTRLYPHAHDRPIPENS